MKVAVVGAGQAGIEAAVAARKAGATAVTVYSREACLPYFRSRLPEIAFGNGDVASIAIHPQEWYEQAGLTLRLDTPVTNIEVGDMLLIKTPDGDEMVNADGEERKDKELHLSGAGEARRISVYRFSLCHGLEERPVLPGGLQ